MKTPGLYFFRTLSVMVAMPLAFIIIYPIFYLVLPETTERLADLPRDLALFLLLEVVVVPITGVWLYIRVCHLASDTGLGEAEDTRDIL